MTAPRPFAGIEHSTFGHPQATAVAVVLVLGWLLRTKYYKSGGQYSRAECRSRRSATSARRSSRNGNIGRLERDLIDLFQFQRVVEGLTV